MDIDKNSPAASLCILFLIAVFSIDYCEISNGQIEGYELNDQNNWDRLLNDEMSIIKKKIDAISSAAKANNFTKIKESIDKGEFWSSWNSVVNELRLRNKSDIISSFESSVKNLKLLTIDLPSINNTNDDIIKRVKKESKNLNMAYIEIEKALKVQVVDYQKLVLSVVMPISIIACGLYAVPKIRKKLNIKY